MRTLKKQSKPTKEQQHASVDMQKKATKKRRQIRLNKIRIESARVRGSNKDGIMCFYTLFYSILS